MKYSITALWTIIAVAMAAPSAVTLEGSVLEKRCLGAGGMLSFHQSHADTEVNGTS